MPRPPTQSGPFRRAFHTLVALVGWFVFSWWWWLVIQRVGRDEVRYTVLFVALTLVVCVGLTGLWAFHNLRLFRRRGPRTRVREAAESFTHDRRGRSIDVEAPIERLKYEPYVWIAIDRDRKLYGSGPVLEPERIARSWVVVDGTFVPRPVGDARGADVGP